MHTLIMLFIGVLSVLLPTALHAAPDSSCYKLDIQKKDAASYAVVTLAASGKKLIEVKLPAGETPSDTPPTDSAARMEDFNFDGYPDLAVFAAAGNVQVFYSVYLFDPSQQKFIFNKKLSSLPCVEADPGKKMVLSSCNHSSACENWSETYRWSGNALTLVSREGTKCSSKPGCYFEYSERLQGTKLRMVSNKQICE